MSEFNGFSAGRSETFLLPNALITELLPLIDDLTELQVTLYVLYAIQQQAGPIRILWERDVLADETLGRIMAGTAPWLPPGDSITMGLERAVARGTLLSARVSPAPGAPPERLILVNTDIGRDAVRRMEAGVWTPAQAQPPEPVGVRPNVFALYEAHIGPLTPFIADTLKDAERDYPAGWVNDAILVAAGANARGWRYVQAVLDRWKRDGKTDLSRQGSGHEIAPQSDERDGSRFVSGSFAEYIEH